MSTRSTISVLRKDGTVLSAYCHWDGYISHNGKLLFENYNTQEAAEQLVSGGDMSSLGKDCSGADGHSFNTPVKDQTVYYGRDRGETETDAVVFSSQVECLLAQRRAQEYNYLFANGYWYVAGNSMATEKSQRLTAETFVDE